MRSFNERSGASSSEGGGEFECRVSTYLPSFFFFFGGGHINSEWRKYLQCCGTAIIVYILILNKQSFHEALCANLVEVHTVGR